jgi:hypothetical protein
VLARFDLYADIKPFGRCTRCNGLVIAVDKNDLFSHAFSKEELAERLQQNGLIQVLQLLFDGFCQRFPSDCWQ